MLYWIIVDDNCDTRNTISFVYISIAMNIVNFSQYTRFELFPFEIADRYSYDFYIYQSYRSWKRKNTTVKLLTNELIIISHTGVSVFKRDNNYYSNVKHLFFFHVTLLFLYWIFNWHFYRVIFFSYEKKHAAILAD